ncbi:MAG: hypothetical protein LAO06_17230 [Acidobacteriia bacterium]|nr:hypothetical protein [Terriglobia bacterium]
MKSWPPESAATVRLARQHSHPAPHRFRRLRLSPDQRGHRRRRNTRLLLLSLALGLAFSILFGWALFCLSR